MGRLISLTMVVAVVAMPRVVHGDDSLNCVLLPDEQVDVSSPIPGVVQEVLVERAQHVSGGEVIARMESTVEAATVVLASARAGTSAEIELRRIEHEYDAQHRDRLQKLQMRNATSSQSLDDASRLVEAARLRVRLAEDRHREATLERKRADAMLALKTIRSPIDGVVVQRHKAVGEYVEAHPIVSVARLDPLRVEVITPLSMFGTVHKGMHMAIRAETDADTERLATVTAVDAVADPGSGTFGVQLELPNPGLRLPAGVKCSSRFLSEAEVAELKPAAPAAPPAAVMVAERSTTVGGHVQAIAETDDYAPSADCLAFDTVASKQEAVALAEAARSLGAAADLKEVSGSRAVGYVVVSPALATAAQRRELAARMRQAGVSDVLIFERGDFSGRVAVGAYKGPVSAGRRQAELAEIGFDTEVQPRTRNFREWRVDVRLPDAAEASRAHAAIAQAAGNPSLQASACRESRAAAH